MSGKNGNGNGGHGAEAWRCPACGGPIIQLTKMRETTGYNSVCDDCLRPVCLKLARSLERGGGSMRVRVLDVEQSVMAHGSYVRVFIDDSLMSGIFDA